jgi:hypothetical protein
MCEKDLAGQEGMDVEPVSPFNIFNAASAETLLCALETFPLARCELSKK